MWRWRTGSVSRFERKLGALARRSGVRSILVKDESQRFGLNAFKALGGLFALPRRPWWYSPG